MVTKTMRNFPRHTLEEALALPRKIQDEMAGKPFKRLLLADALDIKPGSSNFRDLLSSSFKYGFTEGTEKASEIALTPVGNDATQTKDETKRIVALRKAALAPTVFRDFFAAYVDRKLPSPEMLKKLLTSEYNVPTEFAEECARLIVENGRFVRIIQDIGGSPHVIMDEVSVGMPTNGQGETTALEDLQEEQSEPRAGYSQQVTEAQKAPRPIFVGHGKNRAPLEKLLKILSSFQIPHKVVVEEANLGRPIPQKVRETMLQCGSAILIFTRDEKFHDEDGNIVWRPSENVVYELGAASFAYEDRVVVFKESGLDFPTNFQSVGHIQFEEDGLEAKTTDLLKELIGFGLVKITTS